MVVEAVANGWRELAAPAHASPSIVHLRLKASVRCRSGLSWLPFRHPQAGQLYSACAPVLDRARTATEGMFCRLKDLCRIATRSDRLATNFLAAVCLAAIVSS
jgi:transposase